MKTNKYIYIYIYIEVMRMLCNGPFSSNPRSRQSCLTGHGHQPVTHVHEHAKGVGIYGKYESLQKYDYDITLELPSIIFIIIIIYCCWIGGSGRK